MHPDLVELQLPAHELKVKLIRSLVKKRVSQDPSAAASAFTMEMVDALPDTMLMGMPEATIIGIMDAFVELRKSGLSETVTLCTIERNRLGMRDLPKEMSLDGFVSIDCSQNIPIRACLMAMCPIVCC